MAVADELVEWTTADGTVIEVVTRARMRSQRLRHRSVYIVVLDGAGGVVVHQRAAWKDIWPSAWDLAFGGVAGVGESWEEAAARELAEEAGLRGVTLDPLGDPFTYDDDAVSLVGRAYLVRSDEPVRPADGEVVALDRVPLAGLRGWAEQHEVCADSRREVLPRLLANV